MAMSYALGDSSALNLKLVLRPDQVRAENLVLDPATLSPGAGGLGGGTRRLDMKWRQAHGACSPMAVVFPWVNTVEGFYNVSGTQNRGRPAVVMDLATHPDVVRMLALVQKFVEDSFGELHWTTPLVRTRSRPGEPDSITMWTPTLCTSQRVLTGVLDETPNTIWRGDLAELSNFWVHSLRIRPIVVFKGLTVEWKEEAWHAYWNIGIDSFKIQEISWKARDGSASATPPAPVFRSARDLWQEVTRDEPQSTPPPQATAAPSPWPAAPAAAVSGALAPDGGTMQEQPAAAAAAAGAPAGALAPLRDPASKNVLWSSGPGKLHARTPGGWSPWAPGTSRRQPQQQQQRSEQS